MIEQNKEHLQAFEHRLQTQNYAPKTIKLYVYHVKKLLSLLDKPIHELRNTELELLWIKSKGDLSKNTLRGRQICYRQFFTMVKYNHPAFVNIFKGQMPIKEEIIEPNIPQHKDILNIVLTALDVRGNNQVFKFIAARNAALIVFLADTGLRVGECVQVRFSDIITKNDRFEVNVPRIKDSPGRVVPFGYLNKGALVGEIFAKYYQTLVHIYKAKPKDPLFPASKNRNLILQDVPLRSNGVWQIVNAVTRRAGYNNIHPHIFRHYYGTYSYLNGTNLKALKYLMGHRMVTTTERYVHIAEMIEHKAKQQPTYELKLPQGMEGAAEIHKQGIIRLNK